MCRRTFKLAGLDRGYALSDGIGDVSCVGCDGHGADVVVDVLEEEGTSGASGLGVGVDVVGCDKAAEGANSGDGRESETHGELSWLFE